MDTVMEPVNAPAQGITVRYSCALCGIEKQEVLVRYRNVGEGVVEWVRDIVGLAISDDHRSRHPYCNPKMLSEVMIPVPEYSPSVGYAPHH